mmetsp:Transcript_8591/g.19684  ORF Transcript_8591/g.19684 Transcript_8591/m.19684 type:complete len:474 (+) Transcript_8591:218-1639(+)
MQFAQPPSGGFSLHKQASLNSSLQGPTSPSSLATAQWPPQSQQQGYLQPSGGGMQKKVFSMADLGGAMDTSANRLSNFGYGRQTNFGTKAPQPTDDDPYGIGANSDDDEDMSTGKPVQTLTETNSAGGFGGGRVGLLRVNSQYDMSGAMSPMLAGSPRVQQKPLTPQNLLVVFDMDHTLVGDLVSLSDRDNVETNVPWTYWPEGTPRGLGPEFIMPYFTRGMLRPGLLEFLQHLRAINATIVVYTLSEEKWAAKVCEAMERAVGWKFITHLFSRMDCKDGHPEFQARKSLDHVIKTMKRLYGMNWITLKNTIMFDDDGAALPKHEQSRLVKVAAYDYFEACQWDETVNEAMMARNPPDLADMARRSVAEWGIAPPSYGKKNRTPADEAADARWATALNQKREVQLAYNKVAKLDTVMFSLKEAFSGMNLSNLESLPEKARGMLTQSGQPRQKSVGLWERLGRLRQSFKGEKKR